MGLLESLRVALDGLASNRLRSALTMLGVIFGVGAVIAAVSMTEGARAATLKQFEAFGTNILTVRAGQGRRGPVRGGMGSVQTLTETDAKAIVAQCPTVEAVVPEIRSSAQVEVGNANTNTQILGVTANFPEVENYTMAEGNFFTAEDVKQRRKVAVLGPTVVENLLGEADAPVLGQHIRIGGVTFDVVGKLEAKGDMGFFNPDDQIVVPISTARHRLGAGSGGPGAPPDTVRSISVKFPDLEHADKARAEVEALLRSRHDIGPEDEDDFHIRAAADLIAGAQEANRILTLLFGSIAAVSLLVGGIGIMNIMLVSVTERTREIGLRKAVGATPDDILLQFLIESITLSLLGGTIGVIAGVGGAYALRLVGLNTAISWPWVAISFSFAGFVGVFFGLLPSRKAARLDPIEALRYE
ncbi:MAG: ABC transporter permease [Armatimonadetes bacterium]|nr:ABC transporter permease [Armatimonadota bacterium]